MHIKAFATQSPPYIPQELVDHIIDHLYDNPPALINSSLVCRAWVSTTRLHLFSKVSLKSSPSNTFVWPARVLCRRLYKILLRSPHLASYVHELEIFEGLANTEDPSKSASWVFTEDTLPLLLHLLTSLKRLEFRSADWLYWDYLSPSLQNAIYNVFALPSLTYIRLHSWAFPRFVDFTALFARCHNMQGLALSCIRVLDDEDKDPDSLWGDADPAAAACEPHTSVHTDPATTDVSEISRLEFLTLDYVNCRSLGRWLLGRRSTFDVTSLRELRVAHSESVPATDRLLRAIGCSLEHFHLKPGAWDVYSFDLGLNASLRSIRLTLEDPQLALAWVTALLARVSSPGRLERVGIEFYADLKQMRDSSSNSNSNSDGSIGGWSGVDAVLARPEFSALRQVDIGLFAHPTHAEFVQVRRALRGLESRGVLRVYQLGIKSQRSSGELTPRISRYQC